MQPKLQQQIIKIFTHCVLTNTWIFSYVTKETEYILIYLSILVYIFECIKNTFIYT